MCSDPSTLNIGTIQGGRAPNVIPDEARAEIFVRVVGDVTEFQSKGAEHAVARQGSSFVDPGARLTALEGLRHRGGVHD